MLESLFNKLKESSEQAFSREFGKFLRTTFLWSTLDVCFCFLSFTSLLTIFLIKGEIFDPVNTQS